MAVVPRRSVVLKGNTERSARKVGRNRARADLIADFIELEKERVIESTRRLSSLGHIHEMDISPAYEDRFDGFRDGD